MLYWFLIGNFHFFSHIFIISLGGSYLSDTPLKSVPNTVSKSGTENNNYLESLYI